MRISLIVTFIALSIITDIMILFTICQKSIVTYSLIQSICRNICVVCGDVYYSLFFLVNGQSSAVTRCHFGESAGKYLSVGIGVGFCARYNDVRPT